MSWFPDFVCIVVAIIAFNVPCEGIQVGHAVLQLWWVELNIGTSDPASWGTNNFCVPCIDSSNFCQILNLLKNPLEQAVVRKHKRLGQIKVMLCFFCTSSKDFSLL